MHIDDLLTAGMMATSSPQFVSYRVNQVPKMVHLIPKKLKYSISDLLCQGQTSTHLKTRPGQNLIFLTTFYSLYFIHQLHITITISSIRALI